MRKLILSAAVIAAITFSGCGNAEEKHEHHDGVPADTTGGVSVMKSDATQGDLAYICPCGGCPEIKPGKCSKCQMDLVEEKK